MSNELSTIDRNQRIAEINALAASEGITLPWPAAVIAAIEERGGYVDLTSGMVGSGEERVRLTVVGEAVAVVEAQP